MPRFSAFWNHIRREREAREVTVREEIEIENEMYEGLSDMAPNVENLFAMEPMNSRTYIRRDRASRHDDLMRDYFNADAIFPDHFFRRRFRMRRQLFERILHRVTEANPYFVQLPDCTGRLGLSPLQKVMAAVRVLAYGFCFDSLDDIIKIGAKTAKDATIQFCNTIIVLFKDQYLRDPTTEDIARLMEENKERGFPGMIGSLDCMHWRWDACPIAWRGHYNGRYGYPTVVLEAVASQDLWIWHAFFGMAGSNNDITILDHSDLFKRHLDGTYPNVQYEVNGNEYNLPYYLTDGIYPKYATLIQAIKDPMNQKESKFTQKQESCRKDVERAFGVIQMKWHILHTPARLLKTSELEKVMLTCLILHNMIVEDERGQDLPEWTPPDDEERRMPKESTTVRERSSIIRARLGMLRNRQTNNRLRKDLIDHVWMQFGVEEEESE